VFSHALLHPRLPEVNFESALRVSVLSEEELLKFCFKEVILDNLAFKYIVMLPNFCFVL
jgi:hypothetical protein